MVTCSISVTHSDCAGGLALPCREGRAGCTARSGPPRWPLPIEDHASRAPGKRRAAGQAGGAPGRGPPPTGPPGTRPVPMPHAPGRSPGRALPAPGKRRICRRYSRQQGHPQKSVTLGLISSGLPAGQPSPSRGHHTGRSCSPPAGPQQRGHGAGKQPWGLPGRKGLSFPPSRVFKKELVIKYT